MDTNNLEERVNVANQKLDKILQLLNLFNKLEEMVLEQKETIGALNAHLVSLLDNIENAPVLDDAVQRAKSIIENPKEKDAMPLPRPKGKPKKKDVKTPSRPIENPKEKDEMTPSRSTENPKENDLIMDPPPSITEASPWRD